MLEGTTEPLTTYLLRGLTSVEIARIRMMENDYFECSKRTGYGILVSRSEPPAPGCVARRLPGNNLDLVRGWLARNQVDVLCDEYRRTLPGDEARVAAVTGWKQVRETRRTLECELDALVKARARLVEKIDEAKMLENMASEDLIRTHGKTLIMIDGDAWEARRTRAGLSFERKR